MESGATIEVSDRGARLQRAGETVLIAVFFGLATGFIETAILQFRYAVLHHFVWMTPYHFWMAPTVYLIVFGLAGVAIALLGVIVPRRVTPRAATYIFAFAGAMCLTLLFGKLGTWAAAILAAGVAVQVGRVAQSRMRGFGLFVRRATVGMVAAIAILALGTMAWGSAVEHRRMARLPRPSDGAPSVLLIILDTVRAASLSLYGYDQPTTPNLDARKANSVVFERAISTSSWTLPGHASLFTGRWIHELGVDFQTPLDRTYPTLAEVLQQNGYATGGFAANDRYTAYDSGLRRGFIRYEDYLRSPKEFFRSAMLMQTGLFRSLSTARSPRAVIWALREHNLRIPEGRWGERKRAEVVGSQFLDWASSLEGRPFFAFLNYYDAHHQYRCPPPFRAAFRCDDSKPNAYHGAIAYLDDRLEQLFREMDRRGVLENTLVVITSDHGEHLGENGLNGHGSTLYMPVLHVPLVMFWGDRLAGSRVAEPVSTREVAATIAEAVGLSPADDPFPGPSLARFWQTDDPAAAVVAAHATDARAASVAGPLLSQIISSPFRDGVYTGGAARIAVLDAGRLYILNDGGREELYSYDSDPMAERNLAGDAGEAALLERLRRASSAALDAQGQRYGATPRRDRTASGGAY